VMCLHSLLVGGGRVPDYSNDGHFVVIYRCC